jgi:hypothetical protein
MEFNFKISKLENLYFFVSNLTEFHFSCRKHFNEDWILATGELTEKEKLALKEIKPIFEKYNFNNKDFPYLGEVFYCLDDAEKLDGLKKCLDVNEYEKIVNAFYVFKNRFDKIYNEKLLVNWKDAIERQLSGERFLKFYNPVRHFFDAEDMDISLNVHLLISPSMSRSASGNANIGEKDLTLEVPMNNLNQEQVELASCVLLHELSHIWFEKNKNYSFAKKLYKSNFPLAKEVIIDSISPSGFPAQIYSKASNPFKWFLLHNLADGMEEYENFSKIENANFQKLKAYIVWLNYSLTASYFSKNKKFDKNFAEKVNETIKKAG